MTQITRTGSGDLTAIKASDGSIVHPDENGNLSLSAATWYLVLGGTSDALLESLHMKWSTAFAATITFETCNFPRYKGGAGSGTSDVTDHSTVAGNWIQENPSTAYVGVVGTGNSATALTITAGGTNAGGATVHLGNLGTRRLRAQLVVSNAGTIRANAHGKD
jgi:hypothetical protein